MNRPVYFCNNCNTPFTECGEQPVCPECGGGNNIEIYFYNTDDNREILPSDIFARLNIQLRVWFFEMHVKLLRDLLTAEVEIKNRRFNLIYNMNSVVSNCEHLINIISTWRSFTFTKDRCVFVYYGEPGCLVTERDWRKIMENLTSVKGSAERILGLLEGLRDQSIMNSPSADETAWDSLAEEMTKLIVDIKENYNFFKYGALIKKERN